MIFGDRPIALTPTEFDVLAALSLNAARVVPYETLLRRVWIGRKGADAKRVRTYVERLRNKLGDDAKRPTYIVTACRLPDAWPRGGMKICPLSAGGVRHP